jgi:dephospho-CoA kinase
MKIIAFVGMPASGKSEAASVVKDMGIAYINMGDVIREEVKRRGLEPTDSNTGGVATDLREKEGMDAVAKRCVPKINDASADLVVVDGVRGIAEVEFFKEEFGNDFTLVFIDSPIELRFERIMSRGRSDDMSDLDALHIRDERELGWGMEKAIEVADIVIENTDDLDEFKSKIRELMERSHDRS